MKKSMTILALLLVLIFAMTTIAGCGSSGNSSGDKLSGSNNGEDIIEESGRTDNDLDNGKTGDEDEDIDEDDEDDGDIEAYEDEYYEDLEDQDLGSGESLDDPLIYDSNDIDDRIYEGQWESTGAGIDICLPDDYVIKKQSKGKDNMGLVFKAVQKKGSAGISITRKDLPEDESEYDTEALYKDYAQDYPDHVFYANYNGEDGIKYDDEASGSSGFALIYEGAIVSGEITPPEASGSPDSDDDYLPTIRNILCSVMPSE